MDEFQLQPFYLINNIDGSIASSKFTMNLVTKMLHIAFYLKSSGARLLIDLRCASRG